MELIQDGSRALACGIVVISVDAKNRHVDVHVGGGVVHVFSTTVGKVDLGIRNGLQINLMKKKRQLLRDGMY